MFYKKIGNPEEGDIIIGTVKKILAYSIFVKLDEYDNKEGMIHISEVAPGRIRNIRDFVREGKVVVCKILHIYPDKGHIDLSLRRVPISLRKKKEDEYKQEQKAEKFIEAILSEAGVALGVFYKMCGSSLLEKYGSFNALFKAVIDDKEKAFQGIEVDETLVHLLVRRISEKIKLPEVVLEARLNLSCAESDGIDRIKRSLEKVMVFAERCKLKVALTYISAPRYRLMVFGETFKHADKILESVVDHLGKVAQHEHVEVTWERKS